MKASPHPRITLVTTCKGRLSYLRRSLPTWLDLDYDNYDIVVVDYDCPDGTSRYIESRRKRWLARGRARDIRCIHVRGKRYFNLNDARNIGIGSTDADLVFVIDADTHIRDKKLLAAISHQYRAGAVFFSFYQVLNSNFAEAQTSFRIRFGMDVRVPSLLPLGAVVSGLSGTACFAKRVADGCGYYKPEINETGYGCDDWEFYIRLLNYHFYRHLYRPEHGSIAEQLDRALTCARTWEPEAVRNVENATEEKDQFYRKSLTETAGSNKQFIRDMFTDFPRAVALRGPGDGASPWAVPASDVGFRTLFGSGVRTAKWFPLWFAGEYGLAVADRGDAATAEPYLVRALASRHVSDSSKWRLEFALAKVQQQLGRRGWRERYRRMLRRLKREHLAPAVRYDMATMCLQVGDLDRARRYYTSVVRSRTWRGKALFDLAALASRQNDSEACRAYLRRYTNEYPMQAHGASYHVGSMYQRLGEFGRARRYFKRARINPALSGGASFHLGEMAYLDGDWASAETHLASCLQLIPDHAKAAAYLASIAEQRRRCA